ncbi:Fungal lipase-like domain [Trinorchestia longiramus]|nr:Fungal lipase-like domain [Trinorchestia longiramus]
MAGQGKRNRTKAKYGNFDSHSCLAWRCADICMTLLTQTGANKCLSSVFNKGLALLSGNSSNPPWTQQHLLLKSVTKPGASVKLLLVTLLFIQHEQVSCSTGSTELRIYLIGVVILLVAVICVTTALVVTSARGGVMDVQARRRVPTILSIRLVVMDGRVQLMLDGRCYIVCDDLEKNVFELTLLVVTWFALFLVLFIIVLLFEPMLRPDYNAAPDHSAASNSLHHTSSTYALHASMGSHYIQLWERRCKILCCASSKDETSLEALRNVADILASIFEDNELVASDIAAALVLLRMQHKYREKREKREMSRRRNRRQQERQEDMRRVESEIGVAAVPDLELEADSTIAVAGTIEEWVDSKRDQPEEENTSVSSSKVEVSTPPVVSLDHDESPRLKLELDMQSPTGSECPSIERSGPTAANVDLSSPGSNLPTSTGSELPSPIEDTPEFYVAPPSSCVASAPHPWMTVANAQHYMKFALASYGWPWYMYGRCFTTFGSMWPFLKFGATCCTRSAPESVYGDNCCLCHTAAMKAITGLDDEDFCLVYHLNNIYEVPFFVAVDHDTTSVIVAIRGTMSLKDTITDMTAQTAPVYGTHCSEPDCLAHKGMVHAANFVYDKLKETQVLHRLLAKFPLYRLVVTGHSLGAGAAVVLSARLKQDCDKLTSCSTSSPSCNAAAERMENTENFVRAFSAGRNGVQEEGTGSLDSAPAFSLPLQAQEDDTDVLRTASDKVTVERVTVISAVPAASVAAPMCSNRVFSTALSRPVEILCFAFSPPGGLCSEQFARHTLEYVMSVVVGDDLVPRLSMHSLHNLRAQIVTVLEQSHQPKFRLLAQGCWFMLFGISETTLRKCFTDSSLYNGNRNVRSRRRNRRKVETQTEDDDDDDVTRNTERLGQNSVTVGRNSETARNDHGVSVAIYSSRQNSPTFGPKRKQQKFAHLSDSGPKTSETEDANTEDEGDVASDGENTAAKEGDLEDGRSRPTVRLESCSRTQDNRSQSVTPTSSSSSQPLLTATAGRLRNYESLENVLSSAPAAGPAQPTPSFVHSPRHTETTLCLPGHVLHVRPSSVNTPGRWKVLWSPPCQFTSLIISPHMMRHHLPQEVMKAMDFALEHNMVPERS